MYKTEYRAHSYQGGTDTWPSVPAGVQGPGNHPWDRRQLAIFKHLRTDYPTVGAAAGGDQHQPFIAAAHAYLTPDTEGFNRYNSARIDDLYLALRKVPPNTASAEHPDVLAVLTAARKLDSSDVAYIRTGKEGTNTQEQAFMLRDMIFDRLADGALYAFRALLTRRNGPVRQGYSSIRARRRARQRDADATLRAG